MSEETNEPMVLPDSDNIPEKFRGKSVDEVVKAYSEAEKMMHKKGEELNQVRQQWQSEIETLKQQMQQNVQQEDTDDDDAFEYISKKDFKKVFTELQNTFKEELKKVKEETTTSTNWEFEKRSFQSQHPELSAKDIDAIALYGLQQGKSTLNEAFEVFNEFVSRTGFKRSEEGVRQVASSLTQTKRDDDKKQPSIYDKDYIARRKQALGRDAFKIK